MLSTNTANAKKTTKDNLDQSAPNEKWGTENEKQEEQLAQKKRGALQKQITRLDGKLLQGQKNIKWQNFHSMEKIKTRKRYEKRKMNIQNHTRPQKATPVKENTYIKILTYRDTERRRKAARGKIIQRHTITQLQKWFNRKLQHDAHKLQKASEQMNTKPIWDYTRLTRHDNANRHHPIKNKMGN